MVRSQLVFTCAQNIWWSYHTCEYYMTMHKKDKGSWNRGQALHDKPWSGCTCTKVMPHGIQWVEELTSSDNQIITDELWFTVSISKGRVMAIIEELGYSKFWAQWVKQMLTVAHKCQGQQ